MINFEMIKYGRWDYPSDVPLHYAEVAAHFDKNDFYTNLNYSLHTEYSFGSRKFSSDKLKNLDTIASTAHHSIPRLWYSEKWAEEFAEFVLRITHNHKPPILIEIHPPFKDYCPDFKTFCNIYKVFEQIILDKYPDTQILIENRCGSTYKTAPFLFSNASDFMLLCEEIEREKLNLRIAFDIPQLFTAENMGSGKLNRMALCIQSLHIIREYFLSTHLWGKGLSGNNPRSAHHGDFNSYFRGNQELKSEFLTLISDLFDDNRKRYMVLEVNSSNNDILSIINDLKTVDFNFI